MPSQEEKLDEEVAVERLNVALRNQYRSALQYSIVAASLLGLEAQALGRAFDHAQAAPSRFPQARRRGLKPAPRGH